MGFEVEFEMMEAVPGGDGRGRWGMERRRPRAEVIGCELGHGEE